MVVFALILLFFANHQSPSILFDTAGAEAATGGNYLPAFALGHVHGPVRRVRLRHRRHVRRGDRSTPAARRRAACSGRSLISGIVGTVFLLARDPRDPEHPDAMAEGQAGGFPIATTIIADAHPRTSSAGSRVGEVYLFVILVSVFVCTLAIQGAATRMMFSMSRDRHLPLGIALGPGQPDVQDAGQRRDRASASSPRSRSS